MWGNPHERNDGIGMTKEIVIDMYRQDVLDCLENGDITIDDIKALSGKVLACSCKPRACHGDVLVEIFNAIMELEDDQEGSV